MLTIFSIISFMITLNYFIYRYSYYYFFFFLLKYIKREPYRKERTEITKARSDTKSTAAKELSSIFNMVKDKILQLYQYSCIKHR